MCTCSVISVAEILGTDKIVSEAGYDYVPVIAHARDVIPMEITMGLGIENVCSAEE